MENNSKYYWNSINTGYKNYPSLSDNEKCDVVVIGGGISGCFTAYYLSQYNLNTILLEKNFIAHCNASTSTGILESTADIELSKLSKLIGKRKAFHAHKLCEKAVDDIEYILYNINFSHIFEKKDILYSINNENMKSNIIKTTDRHGYFKKGGLVDPFKLCHGLLKRSQKKYAKIYENTAATSYDSYTDTIRVNTNTPYFIECKKIVFTNGLSINNVLHLKNFVEVKNVNTIVTTPFEDYLDILNKSFLIKYNKDYIYIRSTCDKRIMISSFNSDKNFYTNDKLFDLFRSVYGYSNDLKIEYSFTTPYGESFDGLPYIGAHPKLENCYLNLPLGRNNICYSAIGAQIIKDLILYNTSPYTELFSFQREQ